MDPAFSPAPQKRRGTRVRHILMAILAVIFLVSVGGIFVIQHRYRVQQRFYAGAASQFTAAQPAAGSTAAGASDTAREYAPLTVDFAALQAVNPDIIGWIWCEGTAIHYPVLQAADNNTYLRHTYEGAYSIAGSIFVEAKNSPGFADANTIIYGHHMMDDTMFSALAEWATQEFYDEHPVIWLLTPQQDYRIELFSGYTTSATSQTYTIFTGPCPDLDAYLQQAQAQSVFTAPVTLEPDARYVLLSTCAYVFENARHVLHGKLVPVDSAGGLPLAQ